MMNLQPRYFDYMKNGTKRIELRLFDEKRRRIKIGDVIEFTSEGDTLRMKVVGLLRYETFRELVRDFDITILADKSMTKEELLMTLDEFYPAEKQAKFGVVGIRVELE